MVAIGVSYLIFEKKMLLESKLAEDSAAPADNALSRSLIGIQVRFARSAYTTLLTKIDRPHYPGHDRHTVKRIVPAGQAGAPPWKSVCWVVGPRYAYSYPSRDLYLLSTSSELNYAILTSPTT